MSRKSISRGFITAAGKGLGIAVAAGAALLAATEIPGLKRYLHILQLAKTKEKTRSSLVDDHHGATYAQAPRRSGGTDEDKGQVRSQMGGNGAASVAQSEGRSRSVGASPGRA
jgi:hypothetical protein